MQVAHVQHGKIIEKEVADSTAFFLRDASTWFSLFGERQTRFEGWFIGDGSSQPNRFYKLVERIEYCPAPGRPAMPKGITYENETAVWQYEDGTTLRFMLVDGSLHVLANKAVPLRVTLDMRGIYLSPEFGRSYSIAHTRDGCNVTYTDSLLDRPLFLSIRGGTMELEDLPKRWQEQPYPRDAARHSPPYRMHAYRLGTVTTDRLTLGTGWSHDEAVEASRLIVDAPEQGELTPGNPERIALRLTEQALTYLHTRDGYYAGLPWFHQLWSRDELLTGLGLPRTEQLAMIRRYLTFGIENGELFTFAGSGTTCADGGGWLALLIREYGLESLEREDHENALRFLEALADGIRDHRLTPSGLVFSGHNATWMDTIGRTGYRLEIQAMYALILQMIGRTDERRDMLAAIRHLLYRDGYLIDGLDDEQKPDLIKRPNAFLAYLLQPDLLREDEWVSCFTQILQACSTAWGGLSSMESSATYFQPVSSGQDNRSYHNGDSWFFVNNLAALALHRLDHKRFHEEIERILSSSTEEILWKHFLGQPGEIASAADGASWGCGIQGFSGGAYVKAVREIRSK